jgi:hypothetical protein
MLDFLTHFLKHSPPLSFIQQNLSVAVPQSYPRVFNVFSSSNVSMASPTSYVIDCNTIYSREVPARTHQVFEGGIRLY